MAYLDIFIDEFAYFSLFPYIIYDHLKCVSRLRATLYKTLTAVAAITLVSSTEPTLTAALFVP